MQHLPAIASGIMLGLQAYIIYTNAKTTHQLYKANQHKIATIWLIGTLAYTGMELRRLTAFLTHFNITIWGTHPTLTEIDRIWLPLAITLHLTIREHYLNRLIKTP